MTERMEELLRIASLQHMGGDGCKKSIESVDGRECREHSGCGQCIAATIDAIARELEEHHVELPVRMKARQAIERENSVLYGYLNNATGSRDAWAEKCRRANERANDLQAREAQLVDLLRDARDEYEMACQERAQSMQYASAWHRAYDELVDTVEETRGKGMLQCIGSAIVGAIIGFGAAAILAAGRDGRDD